MSKPLVEPISVASLTPLNWVAKLFIRDSMKGYITAEELQQLQAKQTSTEKEANDELSLKFEGTDTLAKRGETIDEKEPPSVSIAEQKKYLAFSFLELLKAAYLKTYGFDGYQVTSNRYITTLGDDYEYKDHQFNRLLFIAGFAGFPNRPDVRNSTTEKLRLGGEKVDSDYQIPSDFPKLSATQFALNWFGGWFGDFIYNKQRRTKTKVDKSGIKTTVPEVEGVAANKTMKIVQIPATIFKPVIAVVKVVTFSFKLALDVVKFTEFLPTFIADSTAQGIGYQVQCIREINKSSAENKFASKLGHGTLIFLLGLTHSLFLIGQVVARLLLSPEKNAEYFWATGRSIKIDNWPKTTTALGIVLGGLGVVISIGLSIALWSVLIPLVVGAAMTFAPAVVTPIVTWFLQLPLVGTTIGMVHGTLATLSGVIGAALTPYITAITGLAVGLQIPAEAVALGGTLALLVVPSATFLSFVASTLSDYWALAGKHGPIGVFRKYYFPVPNEGYQPLREENEERLKSPDDVPDNPNKKDVGVPLENLGQVKPPVHGSGAKPVAQEGIIVFSGRDDDEDDKYESTLIDPEALNALESDLREDISPRSKKLAAEQATGLTDASKAESTTHAAGRGASAEPSQQPRNPQVGRGLAAAPPSANSSFGKGGVNSKF